MSRPPAVRLVSETMGFGLLVGVITWAVGLGLRDYALAHFYTVANTRASSLVGAMAAVRPNIAITLSVAGIAALLLLFWLARPAGMLASAGVGLFVGGAAANASERVLYGAVVDYIPIRWPAPVLVNVADIAILTGYVVLGVSLVLHHGQKLRRRRSGAPVRRR